MKKIFTLITTTLLALSVNAQTWKVSDEQASAGKIAAGTVLIDNEFVKAESNFDANAAINKANDVETPITIAGISFSSYTQIRTKNNVSASNPKGDDNGGSMALLVTAKKNTKMTIYYRRQPNGSAYDAGDGKDLKCWNVTDSKSNVGELTVDSKTSDDAYGHTYQVFTLLAGKEYTFWAKGTTIRFYGFNTEDLGGDIVIEESWESKAGDTSPVSLESITATFLNNTSKGTNAGQGTWTLGDSKAIADQNGCEIKFEPKKTGYLSITLGAKLADNKSINMFVDGDETATIAATVVSSGQVIESGATAGVELPVGTVLRYVVEAGKTYNFYCGGTKYAISGFSFKADETAGVNNVNANKKPAAAKATKIAKAGKISIETPNATYSVAGARIK